MTEPKWMTISFTYNKSTRLKIWKFLFLSFMLYNYLKLIKLLSKCLSNQHTIKISPSNIDQLCGRFNFCPQILWQTSFQEVELDSPLLECGLDLWVASTERTTEREKSNFGETWHPFPYQGIKVNITNSKSCWYHVPLIWHNEKGSSDICGILPQNT